MSKLNLAWPLLRARLVPVLLVVVSLAAGAAVTRQVMLAYHNDGARAVATDLPTHGNKSVEEHTADEAAAPSTAGQVRLATELWSASAIEVQPARRTEFSHSVALTGKISLNEDRVAHIYPMVEGAVESVHVHLGQSVRKNDLLVVINSREVGQAKLELYQARLVHDLAIFKDRRIRQFAENTAALIAALRDSVDIDAIEKQFRDRPMGDYRQQLLSAYANYYKSQADFARLEALGNGGAVAGKQFVTAEASRNADRATFQACLEQIEQELENSLLESAQTLKQSETRVAVAETSLEILGYQLDENTSINPAEEGTAISHYPIRAPFDGTVLSKDVALLEHTRPDVQLLRIADLSTVWVTVDVYQEHLPLLASLAHKTIVVRNEAWQDREFKAEVFYTGEIMDESSRTIGLRAVAANDDGLLKPGMFVSVELPGIIEPAVLQVPNSAVQEYEGQRFVFLYKGGDLFERRDVELGRTSGDAVEVLSGLETNDPVVVAGGFVLKSRMLASLMGED